MLQIPQLNDISFEQILQGAVHKIPMLTDEWTDFNRHDPGITTLEVYAWLTDMLNTYMNATGKIHVLKYMKLLGIEEIPAGAATAWVCLETGGEEMDIPIGFPVYAGNKCFLSNEFVRLSANRFCSLIYQGRNEICDLTAFAGEDGSYASVLEDIGQKEVREALYFGFEHSFTGENRLFITVRDHLERQDIPVDFYLTRLNFYVYDGTRWVPVQIVRDETRGLLRSGVLTFYTEHRAEQYREEGIPEGYYLKAVPESNDYDIPPEIGKCFLNPVRMIQKQELCSTISLYVSRDRSSYTVPYYISEDTCISPALWEEEMRAYRVIHLPGEVPAMEFDLNETRTEITFQKDQLPGQAGVLELLLTDAGFEASRDLGVTDGCAGQELEFAMEGLYELELLLEYSRDGQIYYTHWSRISDLDRAGCEDQVFYLDQEKNCIRFGDGVHGQVPDQGCRVKIRYCSISEYEQGNVRAGEIRQIRDKHYQMIQASNAAMAAGGRGEDTLEKMQERFEQRILEQNRVVSPEDYEAMVKHIPGLMIRGAKIVSAKEYTRIHGLTYRPYDTYLVVCQENMHHGDRLSPRYEQYIRDYLEQYRLLNTRIRIVPPSYGRINISGSIRVLGSIHRARQEVMEFLSSYLQEKEWNCAFGTVISYGDIFIQLEQLASVERVEELHLSLGGDMGRKVEKGDILLAADCLPFLGDVELEYKE